MSVRHRKLYYFAHPYREKSFKRTCANFARCCRRVIRLMEMGYWVFSPICHSHPLALCQLKDWRPRWIALNDLIIRKTHFAGIILAPGWEGSDGCLREKEMFDVGGGKVLYYEDLVKEGATE